MIHRKSRRQTEPKEKASRKERYTERVEGRENLKRKRVERNDHRKSRRQREPKEKANRKEGYTERVEDRENLKRKRVERNNAQKE